MMELASKKDADYVSIMSIHAAKGMEFSTVFVVGAMDGVLPDTHHLDASIDEEQRLRDFAAQLTEIPDIGFITLEAVDILGGKSAAEPPDVQS